MRKRMQGVLIREVDDEILILDTHSDQIHQLNETAAFIWRRFDESPSTDGLAQLVAFEYSVDAQVARKDVVEALERLRVLNLIQE
jgi:hypothetical protein